SEQGNQIVDVFQRAPVRVLFPQVGDGPFSEAVLINTAGGVAGGDRLDTDVSAVDGAAITLTSQAAERIYCALDRPARITTTLPETSRGVRKRRSCSIGHA